MELQRQERRGLEAVHLQRRAKVTWAESQLCHRYTVQFRITHHSSSLPFLTLIYGTGGLDGKIFEGCFFLNTLGCCKNNLGPVRLGLENQQRRLALVLLAEQFLGRKVWLQTLVHFRTRGKNFLPALQTDLEVFGKLMKNKDFTCKRFEICGVKERWLWQRYLLPKGDFGKGLLSVFSLASLPAPLSPKIIIKNYCHQYVFPTERRKSPHS